MTLQIQAPWLTEKIADRINTRSEYATPNHCPKCKSAIWTTTIPFTLKIDPQPLDAKGELDALIAGRHTYRVQRSGTTTFWLIPRTLTEIKYCSTPDHLILADHQCQTTVIKNHPNYWTDPSTAAAESTERCPF